MSERTGQAGGPGRAQAAQSPEVRWETSGMRSHVCNVANTTSGPDEIILSFGAARSSGSPGNELAVQLIQRIALRPITAKHLLDMLSKLLADAEASRSGSR